VKVVKPTLTKAPQRTAEHRDYLVQLNGLLRPLIQRKWAAMVARLNRLEDARFERMPFGFDRV